MSRNEFTNKFRNAFDEIPFSPDFQERTLDLLRQNAAAEQPKQRHKKRGRIWKAAVALALIAVIGTSAIAGSSRLSPSELASRFQSLTVASLFQGETAVIVEESKPMGDYLVTLHAFVTGEPMYYEEDSEIKANYGKTYIALSFQRKDGKELSASFLYNLRVSPIIDGCEPDWVEDPDLKALNPYLIPVNDTTLQGNGSAIVENGVFYYLYACDNLELFADHTVKLAVFRSEDGNGQPLFLWPGKQVFEKREDGTISFRLGLPSQVMFTLSLDETRADPETAQEMLEQNTADQREEMMPPWKLYGWQSQWWQENRREKKETGKR